MKQSEFASMAPRMTLAGMLVLALMAGTAVQAAMDHSPFIATYSGPGQCLSCHGEGSSKPVDIQHILGSTHYKFEAELPEGYQRDHHGEPVTYTRSGKLWKLCGFPTAVPAANWTGNLRDDPATPHIDTPGGCGRCHIGMGDKPYTMKGLIEPSAAELDNVDCLVCHAATYSRKFYDATMTSGTETVKTGAVMAVPTHDGVKDFSVMTEAAKTVGKTTADTCLRCHSAAGGGSFTVEDNIYASFKRGFAYEPQYDVHAAAGMSCADCHSAGGHRVKRPLNNDLSAYDNVVDHQMCLDCHDPEGTGVIHGSFYDSHLDTIACTTCHAHQPGGAYNKDFSTHIAPPDDDPLAIWKVKQDSVPTNKPATFLWFNGTVGPEITPLGSRGNGKIYPYGLASFNQPVDANNHPIPIKWGIFFKTGNMMGALATGLDLYTAMWNEDLAAATGIPAVPGPFDHYQESTVVFSNSHAITRAEALTCAMCHTTESVLDLDALGYTPAQQEAIHNMQPVPDAVTATPTPTPVETPIATPTPVETLPLPVALYEISAKNADIALDDVALALTVDSLSPKAKVKIKALKKMPKKVKDGRIYFEAGSLVSIDVNGPLAQLFTQASAINLTANDAITKLTGSSAFIQNVTAGCLGDVKMAYADNAGRELAKTALMTNTVGSKDMSVNLTGVLLTNMSSADQDVKFIKVASKKGKDKDTKALFVNQSGISGGDILAKSIGQISAKVADIAPVALTTTLGSKPMKVKATAGTMQNGEETWLLGGWIAPATMDVVAPKLIVQAVGGDILPYRLTTTGEITKLQASMKKVNMGPHPTYFGGRVGTEIFAPADNHLGGSYSLIIAGLGGAADIKAINADMGLAAILMAGADNAYAPTQTGLIKSIKTKPAKETKWGVPTLMGEAWAASSDIKIKGVEVNPEIFIIH